MQDADPTALDLSLDLAAALETCERAMSRMPDYSKAAESGDPEPPAGEEELLMHLGRLAWASLPAACRRALRNKATIAELAEETERLRGLLYAYREALQDFGIHHVGCNWDTGRPCSCGYAEMQARLGKLEDPYAD